MEMDMEMDDAPYVQVASEDGPYIYKFKLVAIPGRSKAPAPPTAGHGCPITRRFHSLHV